MKITIDNTEEQIDWDKQNILEAENQLLIVVTNGVHTEKHFEGMRIAINDMNPNFLKNWAKHEFKLFKGKISN